MQNPKTLHLIDISSFIFRAYYAIRPLTTPDGEPVNAVFGVATMLDRTLKEGSVTHAVVTFDSKEPSFRKTVYEEYKANRSAPPDDLIPQFDRIETLINLMGLHGVRKSGVEADDLIATYCKDWLDLDPSHKVVIVTGDKDLMQLVNNRVAVWDTMNGKMFHSKEVEEKFGLPPSLIRDYLALIGDSSDNVPGVQGIGPKGALELLKAYPGLNQVLTAAREGKVPGKKGVALIEQEKIARLSYDLVTLKEDVKVPTWKEKDLHYTFEPSEELLDFLKSLGFKTLLQKWKEEAAHHTLATVATASIASDSKAVPSGGSESELFISVRDLKSLKALASQIEKAGLVSLDLETTSLNPRAAKIVGIALSVSEEHGYYIPVGHTKEASQGPQMTLETVLEVLRPIFLSPQIRKIGQNLKFDLEVLAEATGIEVQGVFGDTMLADYLLFPENRHGLEHLAHFHLNYQVTTYETVTGKGKSAISFDQVPVDQATKYSGEDAWIALRIWNHLEPMLREQNLLSLFNEVEIPLLGVLSRMERAGISLDLQWLDQLSKEFELDLKSLEKKIGAYAKGELNLNSPKQLGKLLFEELKLPPQGKTKTGFSTDAEVLEKLAPLHEVPKLLLEYREISKLKGTYVDPLPLLLDAKTKRIHTSFHQAVAATGRLSSSDPNLQNIPIRTERGRKIRQAFIPSKGFRFLAADYSQIELRILAHMSGDPELVGAFNNKQDVHRRTAAEIFSIPESAVTDEQRGYAKAINFGLMYGKTVFGLSQELSIPRKEAQAMIDRYFERYHKVKTFLDGLIDDARKSGMTRTMLGRTRRLQDINAKNPGLRGFAERMAMNTPIQGSAADLIKLAMIELDHNLTEAKRKGMKSRLLLQVHDELVLEVFEGEEAEVEKLVLDAMVNRAGSKMSLSVPLEVNMGYGLNWAAT